MRWASCCLLISSEKTAAGRRLSAEMCSIMFIAMAVFPIDGRAATMIISPFCRPLSMSSSSKNPVSSPRWPAVLDHLEDLVQDVLHRRHGAADLFLGDLEDPLFGLVQDDVRLLVRGVGIAQDFVAGRDQLPQHPLLPDDPRVVRSVCRRRHRPEYGGEVFPSPHLLEQPTLDELFGRMSASIGRFCS